MSSELAVELARRTLQTAFWLCMPLLAVALIVSLLINIVQVMTSIQETTVSTVPRLAAVAGAAFVLMPWMFRKLAAFTVQLLSDLHPFVE